MGAEKYRFTDSSPNRWCCFAILDPADPNVWTHASIRGDGLIVTDFGTYDVSDSRLTYWTPLPDPPTMRLSTVETPNWVRTTAEALLEAPRAVLLTLIISLVFVLLFGTAIAHWVLISPLATLSWLLTPNTTWTQEFASLSTLARGGEFYPPGWDKKHNRVFVTISGAEDDHA